MSEEIKIVFDIVKWLSPLAAGIVGYIVNIQRTRLKELSEKIDDIEEKLIETFRDGLKDERKFRTDVMKTHSRHIEEIFNKIKEICVENGKLKTELSTCTKVCDRIKFKK